MIQLQGILEKTRLEKELEIQRELINLSSQVSHDIKSPLAALEMMLSTLEGFPEEKRLITRNSLNRIKDIANDLKQKNRNPIQVFPYSAGLESNTPNTSVTLLAPLIEEIASEKRIQFRDRMNLQVEFFQTTENYGFFANINGVEFKRALSNLIDNAADAIHSSRGLIEIALFTDPGKSNLLITIQDNGAGIQPELLSQLGERGKTFGKEQGSGLGIYHAKSSFLNWGGNLEIQSVSDPLQNHGTQITLSLPKETAPDWFVPKLKIPAGTTVVVLDDDQSIHHVWENRIGTKITPENQIKLEHFVHPDAFKKFFREQFLLRENFVFLMDYEILAHEENGLDLIESLGIALNSILITSHYEEESIRERCARLRVKLIPKNMGGFVPVEIYSGTFSTAPELSFRFIETHST